MFFITVTSIQLSLHQKLLGLLRALAAPRLGACLLILDYSFYFLPVWLAPILVWQHRFLCPLCTSHCKSQLFICKYFCYSWPQCNDGTLHRLQSCFNLQLLVSVLNILVVMISTPWINFCLHHGISLSKCVYWNFIFTFISQVIYMSRLFFCSQLLICLLWTPQISHF